MKKIITSQKLTAIILLLSCFIGFFNVNAEFTDEQKNAIAMLNYITVLTQEVNASKNSRLFMEKAYSSIINNTYPNAVDSRTQSQISNMLDIMESYRMVDVKRERLQFIYEQNQAQAIKSAIPNPLALLSAVKSFDPKKLIASIAYMAIDSVASYMAYKENANIEFIKDGWALDDEEASVLHNSRKGAFSYMISMVRDNNLPGDLTLNEESVNELVNWKNNDNIVSSIRFLESNKNTYKSYGGYWLILANNYYLNKEYKKCLEAISEYEALETRIFRRDYELAKILPLAVAAANEVYKIEEYEPIAVKYAQKILDNTDHDSWALRYFAAQTYIGLYGDTQNKEYLRLAYNVALDNANYLLNKQRSMNAAYIEPVKETQIPKDATKERKNEINKYNKMLKENRKLELAPISEALILNFDLVFALAQKLNISESEKLNIDGMFHLKGEPIFLSRPLDEKYWFIKENKEEKIEIEYGGNAIILPITILTNNAEISVSVKEKASDTPIIIKDWAIAEVKRGKEGNIDTYQALFISEEAKKYSWSENSEISIDIKYNKDDTEFNPYHFEYITEGTKKEWYDYLKVWEGHKNNWYDYAKVWENSVVFKKVN